MSFDLASAFQMDVIDWLAITFLLGGPAAFATGRAVAQGWRARVALVGYMLALGAVVGFLCWALFEVPVIPAHRLLAALSEGDAGALALGLTAYGLTVLLLGVIASIGFARARGAQMARQYPFLS
jgi:hypothetical protein